MYKKYLQFSLFGLSILLVTACLPMNTTGQINDHTMTSGAAQTAPDQVTDPSESPNVMKDVTTILSTYKNDANGIEFQYPSNWQIITTSELNTAPTDQYEFGFILRPLDSADVDPYTAQISASATIVTKTQSYLLYPQVGDSYVGPGNGAPEFNIVWGENVNINNIDWYVYIIGNRSTTAPIDDLAYLAEKDAIVQGSFVAVHYDESKELAFKFVKELDKEMLIALDAQGGNAIFPAHLETFAAILETVTLTTPTASDPIAQPTAGL